jgi:hypothetical protein
MFQNVSHTNKQRWRSITWAKQMNPTKCFSHPNFLLKKNILILIYINFFQKITYKVILKSTLQLMKWNQGHKVTIYIYIYIHIYRLWAPSQKQVLVYIQSLFTLWFMHHVSLQSTLHWVL